jgi:hypothetical protein
MRGARSTGNTTWGQTLRCHGHSKCSWTWAPALLEKAGRRTRLWNRSPVLRWTLYVDPCILVAAAWRHRIVLRPWMMDGVPLYLATAVLGWRLQAGLQAGPFHVLPTVDDFHKQRCNLTIVSPLTSGAHLVHMCASARAGSTCAARSE